MLPLPLFPLPNAFNLSCLNSTTLYLHVGIESYRVLEFFSDGLLVDFPGSSTCRQYNGLSSFGFAGNDYLGISDDNVVGLYDCEDSSLCKADCETNELPDCDGNNVGSLARCNPLSDHSIWHSGDGCRGFSSWVVPQGTNTGKPGVKLEWAIPRNKSQGVCASNADMVNATTVEAAVRCSCRRWICKWNWMLDGLRQGRARSIWIVAPLFILVSLLLLLCITKRPVKPCAFDIDQTHYHRPFRFRKACRTRLFSYRELDEATRGFEDGQKLVDGTKGTIHAGVLGDGSHIAVQKNLDRPLGCRVESGYTLMVAYEYPANGALEEHLHNYGGQSFGLDWYKRLSIAVETASILAYLRFALLSSSSSSASGNSYNSCNDYESPHLQKNDVYDFGLLLLEIISGSKHSDMPSVALQKIKSGKLEEIVDPSLYYHEQPIFRREQIEIVADIATRCLLFGGDGKIRMIDVAKELFHVAKESIDGGSKKGLALDETFSSSSLLQMISMSPDSIHVP
ncbi:hypothetical protein V6N13_146692 [Hibiscus sabdariffa]|uniref:Protein kinase domain-containing protein n=1 Tax=Hibiscus sabdariffa TaxID=183260 RepID=A0ABR2TTM3_9ROSI